MSQTNQLNTVSPEKDSALSLSLFKIASWAISSDAVVNMLQSSLSGLPDAEIEKRRSIFGLNEFSKKKGPSKLSIFLRQFKSPLIFMLIGAAVLAGFLHEWLNTIVIMLAVFVNTVLGFYQEYHAEKTLDKLIMYIKERVRVTRDGVDQEIDASEIVLGDIVHLVYGSRIPADSRLLAVNNLATDESILTGESLPVRKDLDIVSEGSQIADRKNMVFAGTMVTEGYGTAVVCRTGQSTELGRIAELVAKAQGEQTPLQKSLVRFGWVVFVAIIVLVIGIFALGISRGNPLGDMLILSAAVAVGAIPEALPISLTVILAVGAERLAKRKGVLRSLAAAETLGSTNLIMTDKTGTLTEAKMKLVGIMTTEDLMAGKEFSGVSDGGDFSPDQKKLLALSVANIDVVEEKQPDGEINFIGRPMEVNIAKSAHMHGIIVSKSTREIVIPFSSAHKFSVGHDFTTETIVALGAPDILLMRSNLSKEDFIILETAITTISAAGNRVLGLAMFPPDYGQGKNLGTLSPEDAQNLVFLGLVVMNDPIREEVPAVIRRIEASGANVVMVTGDMKGTAASVARELGWEINEGNIISGSELHQITDEELLANLNNIKVFARVTPEDKLRIGMLYKKLGYVVAMTGDGVNDAPSLKAVDIGIALGSGSDVAKSAADLVLLDDNFKTIVVAIEEGRRILANIRKAFVYLMSSALDGVILLGGSLLFGLPLPLTALHLIWINFFTGSLPALSFAFDDDYDHERISRRGSLGIFNREVTILTAGIGVLTSIFLFVLYYYLIKSGMPFVEIQSIMFACFASYILVATFSFRSLHKSILSYPPFANKILNVTILFGLVICAATYVVPFLRDVFSLSTLPKEANWILPTWLVFNVVLVEFTKWCFRIYSKYSKS